MFSDEEAEFIEAQNLGVTFTLSLKWGASRIDRVRTAVHAKLRAGFIPPPSTSTLLKIAPRPEDEWRGDSRTDVYADRSAGGMVFTPNPIFTRAVFWEEMARARSRSMPFSVSPGIIGLRTNLEANEKIYSMEPKSDRVDRTADRPAWYLAEISEPAERLHALIGELVGLAGHLHQIAWHCGIDGQTEALSLFPLDNPKRPLEGCVRRSQKIELVNQALRLCFSEQDYKGLKAA